MELGIVKEAEKIAAFGMANVFISNEACAIFISIDLSKLAINERFGEFIGLRCNTPLNLEIKIDVDHILYTHGTYGKQADLNSLSLLTLMKSSGITVNAIELTWSNLVDGPVNNKYDRIDP